MLKYSFSTLATPYYSVDEVIALAVANNYDGIELRTIRGTNDLTTLEEFGPSRLAETRRKFEDAGLALACLDTSVLIAGDSGDEFDRQRELAKRSAALAFDLGAPLTRIFAGPDEDDPDPSASFPAIAAGLSILADDASGLGVTAAIETHGTLSRSASLIEIFSFGISDSIAVLWDVLHTFRNGESVAEAYAGLQPYLRHVHMKDASGMVASGHDFVLSGEGLLPIAEALQLLDSGGYEGFVSFEWEKFWHPELVDAEIAVPHFAQYVAELR